MDVHIVNSIFDFFILFKALVAVICFMALMHTRVLLSGDEGSFLTLLCLTAVLDSHHFRVLCVSVVF